MDTNEQTLARFQTRARQLIMRCQQLRRENDELHARLEKGEREAAGLRARLEERGREYEALKAARMLAVADGDIEASKERLGRLIRDVNKCITLLADQKAE